MNNNLVISNQKYTKMANAIRTLSMDAVEKSRSGHPGMPMGMADVATILFAEFLKFNPQDANWTNRDRFVLSAGHGSMLLYSLLYLTGYPDISLNDIKSFRSLHSKCAGHPEYGYLAGIETTTGPLGQGFANAVGMAIAERIMAERFGGIVDHYTYAIAGDGCLMEGISYEAASLAGHLKLGKLIVLFDDNKITIDGPTSLSTSEDQLARFRAAQWHVQIIDGHNYDEIREAITLAKASDLPSLIACKTTIGYGAPTKSGSESSHGSPLGAKEIIGAKANLDWPYDEFEIPAEIMELWKLAAQRTLPIYNKWQSTFNNLGLDLKNEFIRSSQGLLPIGWESIVTQVKQEINQKNISEATRKSSARILGPLTKFIAEMIGGSADLTGSNDTKTNNLIPITKDNFAGQYIYYGIREHAMAGIMNGMALHKGVIPYGGTFLVFSDYMRPAIRLAALMKIRVIYVMTHDSIGLGEDGPTHQPIEHLASLRLIPGLLVFRPCDSIETAECWQLALGNINTPSLLALSRQNLPLLRKIFVEENLSAKGGYILAEHIGDLKVTIFATGSEVQLALEAKEKLEQINIGARVISMPCFELFDQQDNNYKNKLLGNDSLKVAVEAGLSAQWEKYIKSEGIFIGMHNYGASANAEDLYKYYNITSDEIYQQVIDNLKV